MKNGNDTGTSFFFRCGIDPPELRSTKCHLFDPTYWVPAWRWLIGTRWLGGTGWPPDIGWLLDAALDYFLFYFDEDCTLTETQEMFVFFPIIGADFL